MRNVLDSFAYRSKTFFFGCQYTGRLERIVRTHHQPQFIEVSVLNDPFSQTHVPEMHGIETTAIYSYFSH